MKIRKSFVTNSSSSSFLIARKGDLFSEEALENVLASIARCGYDSSELRKIKSTTEYALQYEEDVDKFWDEFGTDKSKIQKALDDHGCLYSIDLDYHATEAIEHLKGIEIIQKD